MKVRNKTILLLAAFLLWGLWCFYQGTLVGIKYEKHRGGGINVRETKTNNSRSTVLSHVKPSLLDNVQIESRRSAIAAACDNMAERNRRNELSGKLRSEMLRIDEVKNGCNSLPASKNPFCTGEGCCGNGAKGQLHKALSLLWKAESSCGMRMSGDGGLARGHLQFREGTWNDSLLLLGLRDDLSWQWPLATNDLWRCFAVEIAHWQRYCPQALKDGNVELLVRTHRLPSAPYRADNDVYVSRVLKGKR